MPQKITEQPGRHRDLEKKDITTLLQLMNEEDSKVAGAVNAALPAIEKLVETTYFRMQTGGRLFYIGSGTSGRLGILDASECPPTFGVPHDWVIGLIAGGDAAIRKAKEFAEDDTNQAWKDLKAYDVNEKDMVVGISASGSTPYVLGGLKDCREAGITTGSIACNPDTPISQVAHHPVEVVAGPEFVTGSTRMKAGTAQKMVLNMLSTAVMIKLGRVQDNQMVDMQLTNEKLIDRGTKMIQNLFKLDYDKSQKLLKDYGSVRAVIEHYDFEQKQFDQ